MGLFDILGGIGAGLGGAQKGYNQWQDFDLKDRALAQQAALEREKLAENARQFDTARMTDLGALAKFIPGINAEPGTMVDRTNVGPILQALTKTQLDAEERADREATAQAISAGAGRPSTLTGQLAPGEDPEAAALIPRTPNVPPMSKFDMAAELTRRKGGATGAAALMKVLYPEEDGGGNITSHFNPSAGGLVVTGTDKRGNIVRQVTNPEIQPPMSSELRAASYGITAMYGFPADSPQHKILLGEVAKRLMVPQGAEVYGGLSALKNAVPGLLPSQPGQPGAVPSSGTPGQQPEPMIRGQVPPIAEGTVKDIMSAGRTRKAAEAVMKAIQDPVTKNYMGPYGQYLADIQRKAPYETAGKIPPAVIDLQQNLATVQNYTIKLITGAQMGELEATRIKNELPALGNQEDEFKQRMATTLENQRYMEQKIVTLALRGDQAAKAIANDLGLMPGVGSPAPHAPPVQGPAQPPRAAEMPQERISPIREARDRAVTELFPGRKWMQLSEPEKQRIIQRLDTGR